MHYIWTIGKVKTIDIGDTSRVIYDVEWTLTLWQNSDSTGKYALRSGTQSLSTEDLSGFTEWSDVTSSQVETWVKNAMGTEKVNELKLILNKQYNETMTTQTERTLGS